MTSCDNISKIEIRGLSFGYETQNVFERFNWTTFHRLNLLLGPSGCGKTTLLRILAGHIKPADVELLQSPGHGGLVLQDDALFPWLTGSQNFELLPVKLRTQKVQQSLAPLQEIVAPYFDRLTSRLSFGQRRTIELLRILSGDFPLILLDEPLNFLDSEKRAAAMQCIIALASQGTMFVVSTHYVNDFEDAGFVSFRFTRDIPHQSLQSLST